MRLTPPPKGTLSTPAPTVNPPRPVRVALIGCGKTKRPGRHPARELYTGPLFTAALAHAERTADEVFILSALHGLLPLRTEVDSYDRTLAKASKRERDAWAMRVGIELRRRMAGRKFEVQIYAGRMYVDPLWTHLRLFHHDLVISTPLEGLSIGYQLQWLRAAAANAGGAHGSR